MIFADRHDAGRRLAGRLLYLKKRRPIVLALPRGGIAVGLEIARALEAPLELVLAQKLGAPEQPELAVGAIAEGRPPERVLDERLIAAAGITPEAIEAIEERALQEIARRGRLYRGDRAPPSLEGATAILVDDGIATGATTRAALRAVARQKPAQLVLAVPVAAAEALASLAPEVDEVVCLERPARFLAVGQFYESFRQVSDEEVLDLLAQARGFASHG